MFALSLQTKHVRHFGKNCLFQTSHHQQTCDGVETRGICICRAHILFPEISVTEGNHGKAPKDDTAWPVPNRIPQMRLSEAGFQPKM